METPLHAGPAETEACALAFEHHHERLLGFCKRLLGDGEEARDVVAEVFLNVQERAASAQGPILHPKAWLYRCATNRCLDLLRRRNRFLHLFHNPLHLPSAVESEERRAERDQHLERMRNGFDQLSQRDRMLLSLYQEELSYAEMAEATGIKPTSIGKLLSRAIDRFTRICQKGGF